MFQPPISFFPLLKFSQRRNDASVLPLLFATLRKNEVLDPMLFSRQNPVRV